MAVLLEYICIEFFFFFLPIILYIAVCVVFYCLMMFRVIVWCVHSLPPVAADSRQNKTWNFVAYLSSISIYWYSDQANLTHNELSTFSMMHIIMYKPITQSILHLSFCQAYSILQQREISYAFQHTLHSQSTIQTMSKWKRDEWMMIPSIIIISYIIVWVLLIHSVYIYPFFEVKECIFHRFTFASTTKLKNMRYFTSQG